MDKNRIHRNHPDPLTRMGSPSQDYYGPGRRPNQPAMPKTKTENNPAAAQENTSQNNEPTGERDSFVTNQDEQKKTTNAQGSDKPFGEEGVEGTGM
jgi:hypothetical protein